MLPIQPSKNNLIRATTGTANDGGSKSQSGYINTREDSGDELMLSSEGEKLVGEDPVVEEDKKVLNFLQAFFAFINNIFIKLFSFLGSLKFRLPEKKPPPPPQEEEHVTNFLGYTRHNK